MQCNVVRGCLGDVWGVLCHFVCSWVGFVGCTWGYIRECTLWYEWDRYNAAAVAAEAGKDEINDNAGAGFDYYTTGTSIWMGADFSTYWGLLVCVRKGGGALPVAKEQQGEERWFCCGGCAPSARLCEGSEASRRTERERGAANIQKQRDGLGTKEGNDAAPTTPRLKIHVR